MPMNEARQNRAGRSGPIWHLAEESELSVFRFPALLLLLPRALHDAGIADRVVFMTLSDPRSSPWPPVTARKAKLC